MKTVNCQWCGELIVNPTPNQKLCVECAEAKKITIKQNKVNKKNHEFWKRVTRAQNITGKSYGRMVFEAGDDFEKYLNSILN